MSCPVCAALNREHNHECKTEAKATLKQRAEFLSPHRASVSTQDELALEVLLSRKRQAHIAFELHQHQTELHPVEDLAKAAAS
jgi:hypothetical protein